MTLDDIAMSSKIIPHPRQTASDTQHSRKFWNKSEYFTIKLVEPKIVFRYY
jgi:hypothetical protein